MQTTFPVRAFVYKASVEVGTMAFERDDQGMVTGFVLQSDRVRNLRFVKR